MREVIDKFSNLSLLCCYNFSILPNNNTPGYTFSLLIGHGIVKPSGLQMTRSSVYFCLPISRISINAAALSICSLWFVSGMPQFQ